MDGTIKFHFFSATLRDLCGSAVKNSRSPAGGDTRLSQAAGIRLEVAVAGTLVKTGLHFESPLPYRPLD